MIKFRSVDYMSLKATASSLNNSVDAEDNYFLQYKVVFTSGKSWFCKVAENGHAFT